MLHACSAGSGLSSDDIVPISFRLLTTGFISSIPGLTLILNSIQGLRGKRRPRLHAHYLTTRSQSAGIKSGLPLEHGIVMNQRDICGFYAIVV